jgi:sulfofructose kinase
VVADEEMARAHGGANALLDTLGAAGVWGAVTLGRRGVVSHDGSLHAPQVAAVDSTGAGDVFHGAFALALAEGSAPARALRFASSAGAARCALGDVPRRDDVLRLMEATYG